METAYELKFSKEEGEIFKRCFQAAIWATLNVQERLKARETMQKVYDTKVQIIANDTKLPENEVKALVSKFIQQNYGDNSPKTETVKIKEESLQIETPSQEL